jgi:formyltetrahydrofolate deformylase
MTGIPAGKVLQEERAVFRLTVACPDQLGIVAQVAQCIADSGGWITEAAQHTDTQAQWFFMRWVFSLPCRQEAGLRQQFTQMAASFAMQWLLADVALRSRVVLLVSREPHCLTDVLARWRSGELPMEIPAILSNHPDLEEIAACYRIPFEYLPVREPHKEDAFRQLQQRFLQLQADTIVLARYMQILPPWLCAAFQGKVINIHHSFLPSFVGARPYHQAFARGVKLIGATCHYVTADLDAGPIIEQDVVRVRHDDQIADLVRKGRDVERWVLAKGLRYHLEGRVLTHQNKTIVFD